MELLEIESGGVTRYFTTVVSESSPMSSCVIVLHGGGQNMYSILKKGTIGRRWVQLAHENNFLLVVPNGYNPRTQSGIGNDLSWNDLRPNHLGLRSDQDDTAFILAVKQWVVENYGIDEFFVAGSSNGGMMVMRLLVEASEHFDAAAAFIASLPVSPVNLPLQGVPLVMVNGTADPFVQWEGGPVGQAEPVRAVRNTLDYFLLANNCNVEDVTTKLLPNIDPDDGCMVFKESYFDPDFEDNPKVVIYRVEGGGHSIPATYFELPPEVTGMFGPHCHDISGIDRAWQFMSHAFQ